MQEKRSLINISDSFTKMIIVRNTQKERIDEDGIITICTLNI